MRELEESLKKIEKSPHPLILLVGDNDFAREKLLSLIRKRIREPHLNLVVLNGDELSREDFISHITSFPFFSDKKFVVVRRGEKFSLSSRENWEETFSRIPSSIRVLIFLEKEKKEWTKSPHLTLPFPSWRKDKMEAWVKEKLKEEGKILEEDAWEGLWERNEGNLFALEQELEKLILYTGKRKKITLEDVEKVSCEGKELTVFRILDLLLAGRKIEALQEWSKLSLRGVSSQQIIGVLNWEIKRILKLKEAAGKEPLPHLFYSLKIWGRERRRLYQDILRSWTWERLERLYSYLLETDYNLKSGYPPTPTLELLFMRFPSSERQS